MDNDLNQIVSPVVEDGKDIRELNPERAGDDAKGQCPLRGMSKTKLQKRFRQTEGSGQETDEKDLGNGSSKRSATMQSAGPSVVPVISQFPIKYDAHFDRCSKAKKSRDEREEDYIPDGEAETTGNENCIQNHGRGSTDFETQLLNLAKCLIC